MEQTQFVSKLSGVVFDLDGYSDEHIRAILKDILSSPYSLIQEKVHALLQVVEDIHPARRSLHLGYVLENYGVIPARPIPGVGKPIPVRIIKSVAKYRDDVISAFVTSIEDNPTPNVLAARLLTYLPQRFRTQLQRAVALTYILADPRIPYLQLDPAFYDTSFEGDEEDVNVEPPGEIVLISSMTSNQLMVYHAFQRLGPSPALGKFFAKLLQQQKNDVEIFNLLHTYSREVHRVGFDTGVDSVQAVTYQAPPLPPPSAGNNDKGDGTAESGAAGSPT